MAPRHSDFLPVLLITRSESWLVSHSSLPSYCQRSSLLPIWSSPLLLFLCLISSNFTPFNTIYTQTTPKHVSSGQISFPNSISYSKHKHCQGLMHSMNRVLLHSSSSFHPSSCSGSRGLFPPHTHTQHMAGPSGSPSKAHPALATSHQLCCFSSGLEPLDHDTYLLQVALLQP